MSSTSTKGFEPISKVMESAEGSFVVAEWDPDTNEFRVLCTDCPDMRKKRYRSAAGAILAASYHADMDPAESFVPTVNAHG